MESPLDRALRSMGGRSFGLTEVQADLKPPVPGTPVIVNPVPGNIAVIDGISDRISSYGFSKTVTALAAGATDVLDNADSLTFGIDCIIPWCWTWIGVDQLMTFEAAMFVGWGTTYAAPNSVLPPFSGHKHSVAPYVDHEFMPLNPMVLIRKGQTLHFHARINNTAAAQYNYAMNYYFGLVPVGSLSNINILPYDSGITRR